MESLLSRHPWVIAKYATMLGLVLGVLLLVGPLFLGITGLGPEGLYDSIGMIEYRLSWPTGVLLDAGARWVSIKVPGLDVAELVVFALAIPLNFGLLAGAASVLFQQIRGMLKGSGKANTNS